MRRWYWFPSARPTFRVIEKSSVWFPFKVQRRYRWLLMELWITIDSSSVKGFAIEEMRRQQALCDKHESERVVA